MKMTQFSVCSKHIICLHCYRERSKCSPLALHTLSDRPSDAAAVLHVYDGMVWHCPSISRQRIFRTWTAFSDYTEPELLCSTVFHF